MLVRTLADWIEWEARQWYSAVADRGLALRNLSREEAAQVRDLDVRNAAAMQRIWERS